MKKQILNIIVGLGLILGSTTFVGAMNEKKDAELGIELRNLFGKKEKIVKLNADNLNHFLGYFFGGNSESEIPKIDKEGFKILDGNKELKWQWIASIKHTIGFFLNLDKHKGTFKEYGYKYVGNNNPQWILNKNGRMYDLSQEVELKRQANNPTYPGIDLQKANISITNEDIEEVKKQVKEKRVNYNLSIQKYDRQAKISAFTALPLFIMLLGFGCVLLGVSIVMFFHIIFQCLLAMKFISKTVGDKYDIYAGNSASIQELFPVFAQKCINLENKLKALKWFNFLSTRKLALTVFLTEILVALVFGCGAVVAFVLAIASIRHAIPIYREAVQNKKDNESRLENFNDNCPIVTD